MTALETLLADYVNRHLVDSEEGVTVDAETELLLDGYVDSVGVIQLVSFIAENLGFEVPPEDVTIEHFGTVSLLAGYLDEKGVTPRAAAD